MKRMLHAIPPVVLILFALFGSVAVAEDSPATKRLKERNKMFEKAIIKVSDSVYTASGYTVSRKLDDHR